MNPQTEKKKFSVEGFLDDKKKRFIVSLIIAVVLWVFVTTYVQPGTSRDISGVPVNFTYDSDIYTSAGLSIVNNPSYTVTLRVKGNGSDIGSLTADDFVVFPKYTGIKSAGSASLSLDVICTASDTSNVTISIIPEGMTVDVVFDTVEQKTVPVRIVAQDVKVKDDYTLYRTASSPYEVSISGPSGEIADVTQAIAYVSTGSRELDSTEYITTDLVFADESGTEVPFTYAEPDSWTAEISLVVYRYAELPLKVNLINLPDGFDESTIPYTLSQSTLDVAGPADVIDSISEISIGSIDMSTFALDRVYSLDINLPSNIVSQENVTNITVSFDTDSLAVKTLNLPASCVQVINLPSSYKLEVSTDRIMNVQLCGPADELEGLAASSVVALIDAEDFPIVTGRQNLSVTLYVPADNRVFAIGSYTVQCQIVSD